MNRHTLFVTGLMLAAATAHAAPTYSTFLEAGAESTSFFDVNNSNVVVGYSVFGGAARSFTWSEGGGFSALTGPAGAFGSNALGISDGGTIVGSWTTSALDPQKGFIYEGGAYTNFDIAGANNVFLRAISPDGRLITGYYDALGITGQGFVYDRTTGTFVLVGAGGNDLTIVQGVTNGGLVVGSDLIRDDTTGATVSRPGFTVDLSTGTRTDVNLPGLVRTAFRAVTTGGAITGWGIDGAGAIRGFSGYPGVLDTYAVPTFASTFLEGNNDAGWLVGQGEAPGGAFHAVLIRPSAVPAPGSLALAALGLVLAVGAGRRRRAAA